MLAKMSTLCSEDGKVSIRHALENIASGWPKFKEDMCSHQICLNQTDIQMKVAVDFE
jgi:hypothetical protein